MKIIKYVVLASVLLSGSAFASESPIIDGNFLYKAYQSYSRGFEHLKADEYTNAVAYMGFVAGVAGVMGKTGITCDHGITIGQEADIVGNYLRDNPVERTKKTPALLAMIALGKKLSCPKEKKG